MTNAGPVDPVSTSGTAPGDTRPSSPARRIFIGADGIRPGWRILIFVAIFMLLRAVIAVIAAQIPGIRALMHAQTMTPALQLLGVITPLTALTAAGVMTRIEHRTFADYGLPVSRAFGKRFWQGVPLGFVMLCVLLGLIAALGGFSVSGMAVTGTDAVINGALYGLGFMFVGVFEEFTFRGYMQSTLASAVGFWPAAVVLSALFGALHLGNPGEAQIGAVMAGAFGLLSAFALRRTGTIWLSIGMHASWDWGETYFFGTPDSGILAQGHLLNSSFQGPAWLTGGSIGPEGSYLVFGVLIAWAVIIHLWFPAALAGPIVPAPSSSTSSLPSSRRPAHAP